MGRVVIATVDKSERVDFPSLAGTTAYGSIETRSVVNGADRSILLWTHDLAPDAQISWDQPPVGHTVYVWSGAVVANENPLPAESVVVVEHNGKAKVRGGPSGARLVHFHQQEQVGRQSVRAGGNVHLVDSDGIHRGQNPKTGTRHILWADSGCPTCEIWLHQSATTRSHPQQFPHFHTEDEIIFVVRGGMLVGRRTLGPGSALAIDKHTIYSFGRAEGGLDFINFRPSDPAYVAVGTKNEPLHDPISERAAIRSEASSS